MKKILLFLLMLVCYNNLFAFVSQGHWRWRKDDGSETTANWLGAQDETVTVSDMSQNIRLRIELYNDDVNSNDPEDAILQYALDGTDDWFTITNTAGTNAFVLAGTSPYVTDLQVTTQQITGVGLIYEAGSVIVSSEKLPAKPVSPHAETEYEYCIKPTLNITPNTTYQFRVETTNHNAGFTTPKLTTAGVLPVTFTNFTIQQQNGGVKLQWSTGFEQNNDHFNVERSIDGSKWTVIKTVQAKGTDANYETFDDKPGEGRNYYRIVQFDKDGKSTATSVKDILMDLKSLFAAVITPNPVVNNINLTVRNYNGVLNVTLANTNGVVIMKQIIQVNNNTANYMLRLPAKPAPGIYMLQLNGAGVKKTIKVLVQ